MVHQFEIVYESHTFTVKDLVVLRFFSRPKQLGGHAVRIGNDLVTDWCIENAMSYSIARDVRGKKMRSKGRPMVEFIIEGRSADLAEYIDESGVTEWLIRRIRNRHELAEFIEIVNGARNIKVQPINPHEQITIHYYTGLMVLK